MDDNRTPESFAVNERDRAYFYRRAETELALAQLATTPAAVKSHYTIANEYLDRAYADGEAPPGEDEGAEEAA